MSATVNNTEKNIKPVKQAEIAASRRAVEAEAEASLSAMERAYRACSLNQIEDFNVLGRLLAVR
ncbi:MAG: hypothetical protein IJL92_01380 [Thermoguttaceae bacterium]|nr:hypothetical protein [Thermoguttaceae bacterium]